MIKQANLQQMKEIKDAIQVKKQMKFYKLQQKTKQKLLR